MAYNQRNLLLTIQQVQETYNQNKVEGVSTMHVYRKFIYPSYFISRATFYTYLGTPANKMLKEMEKAKVIQAKFELPEQAI